MNLREVLDNETENKTMSREAEALGFKPDTIKLYIENPRKIDALTLVVDVDYAVGGDANTGHLLEAKLIDLFNIDVVVKSRKSSDRAKKLELEHGSFALVEESKISQFLGRSLDNVIFIKSDIKDADLQRDLKSANRTIEMIAKRRAQRSVSSASSTLFPLNSPQSQSASSSTSSDEIEDFLAPDNKEAAVAVLQELPPSIRNTVFAAFNAKKRQQTEGKDSISKQQRNGETAVAAPNGTRVSVK